MDLGLLRWLGFSFLFSTPEINGFAVKHVRTPAVSAVFGVALLCLLFPTFMSYGYLQWITTVIRAIVLLTRCFITLPGSNIYISPEYHYSGYPMGPKPDRAEMAMVTMLSTATTTYLNRLYLKGSQD